MKPLLRSANRLYIFLAFLVILLWWYRGTGNSNNVSPSLHSSIPLPLITLIAVFKGDQWPTTLPFLFDNVRNQPEAVELVVIQRGGKCSDLRKLTKGAGNIKHVCLSEKKFWKLHVEYLCRHWGGCSSSRQSQMQGDMLTLGTIKAPHSYYPILRGWVFKKYMSPKSVFWGWCDLDIMLGSLQRTFPYDIALDDYDVIAPTNSGPSGGQRLIFMPGHLTIVRNREETERKLLGYPSFTSFDEWDSDGVSTTCVEEAEFSSYVVGESTINYLAFTGLIDNGPLVAVTSSGVFNLPNSEANVDNLSPTLLRAFHSAIAASSSHAGTSSSSFSADGFESSVDVFQEPPQDVSLWFEPEYASYYISQTLPRYGRWKRFLMRRNGRWTERVEPVSPNSEGLAGTGIRGAEEWLYVHWQEEKRRAHFRELPLASTPIFLADQVKGTAGFDESGARVFHIPAKNEQCDNEGCIEPGQTRPQDSEDWHKSVMVDVEVNRIYVESKSARRAATQRESKSPPTRGSGSSD